MDAENSLYESYYAVIPLKVLCCSALPLGARILYGLITNLTRKEGYCFATNAYLAEKMTDEGKPLSIRTIQLWIEALKDNQFIFVNYDSSGAKDSRKIWLHERDQRKFNERNIFHPPMKSEEKSEKDPVKNFAGGGEIDFTQNNIREKDKTLKETLSIESAKKDAPKVATPPSVLVSLGKHVQMTEAEKEIFVSEHGESKTLEWIQELDDHLSMTGKKYRDFAAALRAWIRREQKWDAEKRQKIRSPDDPVPSHLKRHTNLGGDTTNLAPDADFSKYYEGQ